MMGSSGITRPRRFGKTLFMDALNAFLSVDFDRARQQAWFKGLKIAEEKVFCAKFMGQFAVIFLSLKGVEGQNFQWAYRSCQARDKSAPVARIKSAPLVS